MEKTSCYALYVAGEDNGYNKMVIHAITIRIVLRAGGCVLQNNSRFPKKPTNTLCKLFSGGVAWKHRDGEFFGGKERYI